MAQKKELSAGTTAIVAFIRYEERSVSIVPGGDDAEKDRTARQDQKRTQRTRVLYTANVGDARAVLWYFIALNVLSKKNKVSWESNSRETSAVRLSYDHKGSDPSESLRVQQKGGFMFNSRVNGMLFCLFYEAERMHSLFLGFYERSHTG